MRFKIEILETKAVTLLGLLTYERKRAIFI